VTARASPWTAACAGILLAALAACAGSGGSAQGRRWDGQRIEVLATWSGVEQERFGKVLDAFARSTGAEVTYTSARHRMADVLDQRFAAADLPDVAFLPQPGLLADLARAGRLRPVDTRTQDLVAEHFAPAFARLASYDGVLYGVWFKAANKSLVWYALSTFESAGEVPPRDLDGLLLLADRLARKGIPAFAVAGEDGWTLTDWFENVYLRTAGRASYDELAAHRIGWTHPTVLSALTLLAELLAPQHLPGGTAAALRTSFEESVRQVFAGRGSAAMVSEGDFVAGEVTGGTTALLGVDADVFPFPPGTDGLPAVVGGGDVAVLLTPSAAAADLVRFLATPEAAAVWAGLGGFVSPNLDVDLSVYPDDISRAVARQLLEAGEDFRFDLSDLQPAAFGGSDAVGLRAELIRFLSERDVGGTASRLEAAAAAAFRATS
jgi:ABC-type glycerol-3-phosphate transport system substrate-binding protein